MDTIEHALIVGSGLLENDTKKWSTYKIYSVLEENPML